VVAPPQPWATDERGVEGQGGGRVSRQLEEEEGRSGSITMDVGGGRQEKENEEEEEGEGRSRSSPIHDRGGGGFLCED
jgi:hypothetical protein